MAYSKHTWQDGELITKDLMNNLETGLETAANAVDGKLAKPSSNGTSEQILATDGNGGTKWVNKPTNGATGPAGPKGDKGDRGETGPAGLLVLRALRVQKEKKAIKETLVNN